MKFPFRTKLAGCGSNRAELAERNVTFKYFFEKEQVSNIWDQLQERYGPIREKPSFSVMEIESKLFRFRATSVGNPITIIRKRKCTEDDIERLHALIGFQA